MVYEYFFELKGTGEPGSTLRHGPVGTAVRTFAEMYSDRNVQLLVIGVRGSIPAYTIS
jgi:hypothetical protein